MFIDGSSRVVQGRRCNGYAIIEGTNGNVEEMGKLPSNWSAQTCELYALDQALKLLKGNRKLYILTHNMHMGWYIHLEKNGKKGA